MAGNLAYWLRVTYADGKSHGVSPPLRFEGGNVLEKHVRANIVMKCCERLKLWHQCSLLLIERYPHLGASWSAQRGLFQKQNLDQSLRIQQLASTARNCWPLETQRSSQPYLTLHTLLHSPFSMHHVKSAFLTSLINKPNSNQHRRLRSPIVKLQCLIAVSNRRQSRRPHRQLSTWQPLSRSQCSCRDHFRCRSLFPFRISPLSNFSQPPTTDERPH